MGGRWEVVVRGTEARESRHAQPATLLRESLFGHPSQSPGVHVGPRAGSLRKSVSGIGIAAFLAVRVSQQLWVGGRNQCRGHEWSPQRLQGVRCGFVVCGGGKCVGEGLWSVNNNDNSINNCPPYHALHKP